MLHDCEPYLSTEPIHQTILMRDQRCHWGSVYSRSADHFGTEPSDFCLNAIERLRREGAQTVIELGCGQGRDTMELLRQGFDVIAIDYCPEGCVRLGEKARSLGLEVRLKVIERDIREGIPLPDGSVDACFSHMFFTMHLTMSELADLFREALRVLRPGGLNIYSVRNHNDPNFGKGRHIAEDIYEWNEFVVHYFSEGKVRALAEGYEVVSIEEFTEGALPKVLYDVTLRRPI
jgi:SAM-dependent methyltransferase